MLCELQAERALVSLNWHGVRLRKELLRIQTLHKRNNLEHLIFRNSHLWCVHWNFWRSLAISAILGFLYPQCSSFHKTKSRLHTSISTVVHAETVCAPRINLICNFFTHSLRYKIIISWLMSDFQKSPTLCWKCAFCMYDTYPIL